MRVLVCFAVFFVTKVKYFCIGQFVWPVKAADVMFGIQVKRNFTSLTFFPFLNCPMAVRRSRPWLYHTSIQILSRSVLQGRSGYVPRGGSQGLRSLRQVPPANVQDSGGVWHNLGRNRYELLEANKLYLLLIANAARSGEPLWLGLYVPPGSSCSDLQSCQGVLRWHDNSLFLSVSFSIGSFGSLENVDSSTRSCLLVIHNIEYDVFYNKVYGVWSGK